MAGTSDDRMLFITIVFVCLFVMIFLVDGTSAFGAGNIPSYAYLEDKAFRHGDIEIRTCWPNWRRKREEVSWEVWAPKNLEDWTSNGQVYFGNWLRDYSQAMDVAGLSKLAKQTIINLVMALGFLAHGYATGEFEVTEERLGVYLPVEHIDNPKDYNSNNDARAVHPGLRGPIDPRELQIDPRTGMKNYIANETGHWDTSAACIRRVLSKCIDIGRRAKNGGGEADYHEAYRLLGTALHTLEDLTAHSNWCELSLRRLGHTQVFCHVGDACIIDTPSGRAPPLITGVFGAADFLHSLLGEATDHISEASVSDLSKAMSTARSGPGADPTGDALRSMLFQMPSGGGSGLSREMDDLSEIRSRTAPGSGFDPSQMSPQELHATMWKVLKFRDDVCKSIERTIEKIPGLSSLTEKIGNAVNKFVFTTLEPFEYLKPIMLSATGTLQDGSAAVINKQDQYETFNNPHCDDPTHSLLSKDHFGLILNEPAGNLAKIIVKHTVKGVVEAWDSTSVDPHRTVNKILEAFHHPYFVDGSSDVQREMGQYMRDWIGKMSDHDRGYVLNALTKESVRNGKNKRRAKSSADDGEINQPGSRLILLVRLKIGYNQMQGLMSGGRRDMDETNFPREPGYASAPEVHSSSSIDGTTPSYNQSYGGPESYPSHDPNTGPPIRHDSYPLPMPGNAPFPGYDDPVQQSPWGGVNVSMSGQRPPPPPSWNSGDPQSQQWNQGEQRPPPPPSWGYSQPPPDQNRYYPPGGY
ncbi:uncharacterized protein MELLADRAFT_76041 [Melampsora larici-populina 98AG31]|uniref:Heterokaryon incompatibility protein HET-C n=1 Tax=Melampsora larici-populina (strain 98AG31 / pathotype 3-4-7) TaxID=747676 RepID=F4S9I4_MELLP|nr:uncharacterized protein MELLADRAFT_76041 [Melampsora larici-populina 98AG31]EGF98696.1 hypothetical protein MELLADRAFT_76041 [Melampsora larici-populina 98AG31]